MFQESPEDFLSDFSANTATLRGSPVSVILDSATVERGDGYFTTVPVIVGSYDEIGGALEGDNVSINGVSFEVAEPPQHDGEQLLTTLVLRRA